MVIDTGQDMACGGAMADGGPILTAGNVGPRRGTEDRRTRMLQHATECYYYWRMIME